MGAVDRKESMSLNSSREQILLPVLPAYYELSGYKLCPGLWPLDTGAWTLDPWTLVLGHWPLHIDP